ncbi:MAG: CU044_2847 family protein, partial [Anaerolineales bacterium]|nr:CU044_2847 family protein [Anaerolineales bacterium]
EQALQSIQSSANLLVSKLRDLSQPPDELEVTFSLKTSAEVGTLFIAKGGAEASYNVALRWRREERREEKKDGEKEEKAGE